MKRDKNVWKKVKRYRGIYLMLLPVLVYFLVFSYYPLVLGIINSFQKVKILGESEFADFGKQPDRGDWNFSAPVCPGIGHCIAAQ